MTKGNKIILGVFTFLPFVLICLYMISVTLLVKNTLLSHHTDMPFPILGDVVSIVIVTLALGLLSFGLLIYYIVHALNNPEIDGNEKVFWAIVFVFASIIGFPVYWYLRIWKRNEMLTMSAT